MGYLFFHYHDDIIILSITASPISMNKPILYLEDEENATPWPLDEMNEEKEHAIGPSQYLNRMSIISLYNTVLSWIARCSSDVVSSKEIHRSIAFQTRELYPLLPRVETTTIQLLQPR
jgi:hypothetical protein